MGDHDTASVVHQLANQRAPVPELTPALLIERYCAPGLGSAWRSETREHSTWHAGFCSYMGSNSYGPGIDGYDDGYDFMGSLGEGGWCDMANYGDWPYLVYLWWPSLPSDPRYCIAHYCEGDFGIEVFDSIASARAAAKDLTPCP